MTVERLAGPYSGALLLSLLKKLYALRSAWNIVARLDEEHSHGVYVQATHVGMHPDSAAPAVSNAMVELQPDFSTLIDGQMSRSSGSGSSF